MDREHGLGGLQLDDEPTRDEDVESCLTDRGALVLECDRNLPPLRDTSQRELYAHGVLVRALQEARPEDAMDLESRVHDDTSKIVEVLVWFR
jgi:hypothetical protein